MSRNRDKKHRIDLEALIRADDAVSTLAAAYASGLAKLQEAEGRAVQDWIDKSTFTPETHTLVYFHDWEDERTLSKYVFALTHAQDEALRGRAVKNPDGTIDRTFLAELIATYPYLWLSAIPTVNRYQAARP